jgi:CHAT domain-containing protein
MTDLGDATVIDSLIALSREMIYHAGAQLRSPVMTLLEQRLSAVSGELYDLMVAPMLSPDDKPELLFIAPDGKLTLLPFEILTDPEGAYLIEQHRVCYLSSGRDLIRRDHATGPSDIAVLLADPDFDLENSESSGVSVETLTVQSSDDLQFATFRSAGCLDAGFPPIPFTSDEITAITRTLDLDGKLQVQEYSGESATESVLQNLREPPLLLHLASHGFFCAHEDGEPSTIDQHPLLQSGLALAGANQSIDGLRPGVTAHDDGILTALEVSGINLTGTDLVVLSSCESGVGIEASGEGTYSLRRAFQYSGAQTILSSLWKVPDEETARLMTGFYERWLAGSSKADALRESALEALATSRREYGHGHPLTWGGFVLIGDPH